MNDPRQVSVVTGTRAEYGLLRPVMRAIDGHRGLQLEVLVTGAHLLPPAETLHEVAAEFDVEAVIPMQEPDRTGRFADAAALGRGVAGFARRFEAAPPDVVLVLGDRIEALAAAAAAAIAGVRVAHMHGGDRAEGIADEAIRHAITKLAHIHLPATETSAERIRRLGEEEARIHVVGSPALDGLEKLPPLDDATLAALGAPEIIVLLHPSGDDAETECHRAAAVIECCQRHGRVLLLDPNHDPGREGIVSALERFDDCPRRAHLPRAQFVGLLKRARALVGNSSAGLLEGAALGVPCINLGPRQNGREKASNVSDIPDWDLARLEACLAQAGRGGNGTGPVVHPYGDGRAGPRTADLLASFDPAAHPLRKRNTY